MRRCRRYGQRDLGGSFRVVSVCSLRCRNHSGAYTRHRQGGSADRNNRKIAAGIGNGSGTVRSGRQSRCRAAINHAGRADRSRQGWSCRYDRQSCCTRSACIIAVGGLYHGEGSRTYPYNTDDPRGRINRCNTRIAAGITDHACAIGSRC